MKPILFALMSVFSLSESSFKFNPSISTSPSDIESSPDNVLSKVELPLLLSGVEPRESRKRASQILARVGLKGWEHHRPAELSGGQRQRVTIARALVNNPAIVWGDEPTGDLDSNTSKEIMDLLCELNVRNDQTFVIVTHDLNVAKRAHRIITMRNGRVHEELPPGVLPTMEFLEGSMENA